VFVGGALVLLGTALGCGKSTPGDDHASAGRASTATGGAGPAGTSGKGGGSAAKGGSAGSGGTTGTSAKGGAGGSGASGGAVSGGATATGGASGEAGAPDNAGTNAVGGSAGSGSTYLSQIRQTGVDQLDLLFMIDNSLSMTSKQTLLAASIPALVERLIAPNCVDGTGAWTGTNADASGNCSQGAPEFVPIRDLHVGIITSSLGDHGSNDVCSDAANTANVANGEPASNYNDLAQLLPSVRPTQNLPNWNNSGFLVWDPRDQSSVSDPHPNLTKTDTDAASFVSALSNEALAAGENGCGYESSLESWYRFLIDPDPVSSMTNSGSVSQRGATNSVVLQQRAAFLRPDSVVVIVMMSDENDCSIVDENGTQGWLVSYKGGVGQPLAFHMPRASSSCATDANDKCCRPCSASPATGCPDNTTDSACQLGTTLSIAEDAMNLRCFRQVQRFGVDLLYPTSRYVEGLSKKLITPRFGGPQVQNPLFATAAKGAVPRDPGLVYLAGIVGVPWQDIATTDSWTGRSLTYLDASGLTERWPVILGDPAQGVLPTDTLMVESIDPRTSGYPQAHPLLNGVTIGSASATTNTNPINGHEQQVQAPRDDLQFACIFPLATPVQCNAENADSCDCNADEVQKNSPLCSGVTATTDGQQLYEKAYPGLRELQVLKDFGYNGVVGSICPKNIDVPGGGTAPAPGYANPDPDYGYNPFIRALMSRIKEPFTPKCLPRALPIVPDGSGHAACTMIEATFPADGTCDCAAMARGDVADSVRTTILTNMQTNGECDVTGLPACASACTCVLPQLDGNDLAQCQAGNDGPSAPGYCYIDPAQGVGSDAAVVDCLSTQKRTIRFVGPDVPAKGSIDFVSCGGP
jgi:hypothetical protein